MSRTINHAPWVFVTLVQRNVILGTEQKDHSVWERDWPRICLCRGLHGTTTGPISPPPHQKNKTKQANKQIKKHSAKRAKWMNEIKYKNDITKQAWCLILQNNYWLGDFLNKELLFNFQQISRPLKISQEMILKMHSKNYLWSEHAPQPRSQVLSPTCHPVLPRVLSYPSPDCTFPSF